MAARFLAFVFMFCLLMTAMMPWTVAEEMSDAEMEALINAMLLEAGIEPTEMEALINEILLEAGIEPTEISAPQEPKVPVHNNELHYELQPGETHVFSLDDNGGLNQTWDETRISFAQKPQSDNSAIASVETKESKNGFIDELQVIIHAKKPGETTIPVTVNYEFCSGVTRSKSGQIVDRAPYELVGITNYDLYVKVTEPELLPPEITVELNTDVVKLDHGNYGISPAADLALIGINHAVMKAFKAPDNVALAADVAIWGINQYLSSIPRETFEPDPVTVMVHIKDPNEHKPGDNGNRRVAARLHFDFPRMSLKGDDQYNEYLGEVMKPFWADYLFTYKPEYTYDNGNNLRDEDYETQLTWWAEWGENKEPFTPLGKIEGGVLPLSVKSFLEEKSVYDRSAKKAREIEQKRMISAHCPVNLLVLDAEGNVLAAIETDNTERFEQDGVIAYADGEAKHVIIPKDKLGQYTVKLEGTDAGSMTLVASDMLEDGTVAVHAYADVPLAKGTAYASGLEEEISFTGEDGAALAPDVVVDKASVMEALAQTDAKDTERVSTAILRGIVPSELCENFSQAATVAELSAVLDRLAMRFGLPAQLKNEDASPLTREAALALLEEWLAAEELAFDAAAHLADAPETLAREDCILMALDLWDAIVGQ